MKRQQAEAVLNRFFEECGDTVPSQSDIEPALDRVWERLEWKAGEFVGAPVPDTAPARSFRFVWATGIVLTVVLVNGLLWRQGPPFSGPVKTGKANEQSMSNSSSQQGGETLRVTVPQDPFELVSVKSVAPSSEAARFAIMGDEFYLKASGCPAGFIPTAQVGPGRLTIPAITVLSLVVVAYGQDCTLVEGGPGWARSGEYYEINALLPAGTPVYKRQDLERGNAPRLQSMLQNLLADRFRLVLRREFREMSVYALTVATPGKMKLSPDETRPASLSLPPVRPTPQLGRGEKLIFSGQGEFQLSSHAISMSDLAKDLRQDAGRLVVDKTGLNGVFDVDLKFARDPAASNVAIPVAPLPGVPLSIALEDQLGLKLEPARMPIEVLVIESVERPSEN